MPRADFHTLRVKRADYELVKPQRRICHFKFCNRLERLTVNYANTVDNVIKSGATRVFVDAPEWTHTRSFTKVLNRAAHMLGTQMPPEYGARELEEVFRRFPERKREIYRAGLDSTLELPFHAKCTGFVKQENVPYKKADKPRMIQFRNPIFLAHMLSWMKPLEHAFYHNRYCFNRYQKKTCAKGMSPLERMTVLEEMTASLVDPHFVGLDGSAFDAHVTRGALRAEWDFYVKAMRVAGYHPETLRKARRMGKCQEVNTTRSQCDDGSVKWKTVGNRMSGDLNTGLGNSVLQSCFIAAVMDELGVPEECWRMLVDGDDAVLLVGGAYMHLITADSITNLFKQYSQEVKVEGLTPISLDNMEPIDFCQSRPVRIDGKWRLVRNPWKVYNGYKQQAIYYRSLEEAQRFFATVAPAEMIYAAGVPVHQELFTLFHRLGNNAKPLDAVGRRFWLRNAASSGVEYSEEITLQTRESYYKAFGMPALEQLQIEEELEAWTLDDFKSANLEIFDLPHALG